MHKLEPWAYLRDLFCLLPSWPAQRVLELAPASWTERLTDPDIQQRLEANIFRRATLLPPPQAAAASRRAVTASSATRTLRSTAPTRFTERIRGNRSAFQLMVAVPNPFKVRHEVSAGRSNGMSGSPLRPAASKATIDSHESCRPDTRAKAPRATAGPPGISPRVSPLVEGERSGRPAPSFRSRLQRTREPERCRAAGPNGSAPAAT
jgi:hypothetical protein